MYEGSISPGNGITSDDPRGHPTVIATNKVSIKVLLDANRRIPLLTYVDFVYVTCMGLVVLIMCG